MLALQGNEDEFIATFDTLIGKLEALDDDQQYVILRGSATTARCCSAGRGSTRSLSTGRQSAARGRAVLRS